MPKDKRVKGCSNPSCERNENKKEYKSSENFCSLCGHKLVFVCTECCKKIEDIDEKHKICLSCEAKREDTKQKVKDGALMVAGVVVTTALSAMTDGGKSIIKASLDGVKKL